MAPLIAAIVTLVVILCVVLAIKAANDKDKKGKESGNGPVVARATEAPTAPATQAPGSTTAAPTSGESTPAVTEAPTDTPTPETTPTDTPIPTDTPTPAPTEAIDETAFWTNGGYAQYKDTVYTLYAYLPANGTLYSNAVNNMKEKLGDAVNVYDVIVPISSGVTFPEALKSRITSSDQKEAINSIYGAINQNVTTVNVFDTLYAHRGDYIYFRSDHHWTSYGAYLSYVELMKALGKPYAQKNDYEVINYTGFLGSYYELTNSPLLKANPDTVEAMIPKSGATMVLTKTDGSSFTWPMINDVTYFTARTKYWAFLGGDYPLTELTNSNLNDGSTCLVVKESYGNAFAPFLTDNYQHIYVVDYRYFTGSLSALVAEKNVQDVVLVNNMSMTANRYLLGQFATCVTS